ncbi:MAG TPA: cobalamin biosynthesis protein [Azospirillaceae bacterium]|nr:cobalamin biosynthesis protein [Azospirillaceae bacterium]
MPEPLSTGAGLDLLRPCLVLLAALLVEVCVGDIRLPSRLFPTPGRLVTALAQGADRKLNRPGRGERTLLVRGVLVMVVLVGGAALAGAGLDWLVRQMRNGWILEALLLVSALHVRRPLNRAAAVAGALLSRDRAAAATALDGQTFRHLPSLDEHGMARAAIEMLARGTASGLVAPAFWYLLAGPAGLLAWVAAERLDAVVGRPGLQDAAFGTTAAGLRHAMAAIPAGLAAGSVVAAALAVPGANARAAVRAVAVHGRAVAPGNAGWTDAAYAGALDVALGGPRRRGEVVADAPWIGTGRAKIVPADVHRAVILNAVAAGLGAVLVLAAALALLVTSVG